MSERRAGPEKVNASVESAKDGRRPPLTLEASNTSTGSGRRGSGVDMRAKEERVNMGSPTRWEVRSQPAIREDQAGLRRVAERSAVAAKRVMIVERRDLSSRVRSEGARARAIGESLATSMKRSVDPEGLRCLSEPGHALRVSWVGDRISHLVRKPNAGKLHVRFDERDLETETRSILQTPATERAGQQVMIAPTSTAPDLDSTRRPKCKWQTDAPRGCARRIR
jgi:hypothetical protein